MAGPRLFIVAGEPSGDQLGGALIAGLRDLAPGVTVEGVGGPAMAAAGLASRFPMEELSVMGVAEVLPRLPRLLRRIRETGDAVAASRPDALIGIDSPDFTLRVARRARALLPGLRVIHYVAPSVWAWRPGRAARMAEVVDHVLALLPFEPPYMEAAGMTCDFVGHPLATVPRAGPEAIAAVRAELGLAPGRRLLALLPGSRRGEVRRLGATFVATWDRLRADRPDLAAVIPTVGPVADLAAALALPGARVLDPRGLPQAAAEARKRAALAAADAALAASGTVSLELAGQGTPMAIGYKVHPLTAPFARRMIRIDSSTLVNLVTGTRTVPEFFQEECVPERLAPALARLLDDPAAAAAQRAVGDRAMDLLGRGGEPPGLRAARSVLAHLDRTAGHVT
ncbi:lipid-A-disaccharide synthase [Amaricoccus sp.]|uniref:lipid-A-disaccharide synthase n=1 Tax=Amaricoccus sp. TaxID=1872485 RepID=UPI001B6660B0|nr:lipid-A-disaccharide synthase [Amaricoccus sp.]MBP7000779.1 lipid-A-disaccharide synthase [Amaricoccus sp.]